MVDAKSTVCLCTDAVHHFELLLIEGRLSSVKAFRVRLLLYELSTKKIEVTLQLGSGWYSVLLTLQAMKTVTTRTSMVAMFSSTSWHLNAVCARRVLTRIEK